jgi:S-adenosylmethionine hydrolase
MGEPLLYLDSEQIIGLAINNGDFAERFSIAAGAQWTIRLHRGSPSE